MSKRAKQKLLTLARALWGDQLGNFQANQLQELVTQYGFSVTRGDLCLIGGNWYVSHRGLLALSVKKHCRGIQTEAIHRFCDPSAERWAFKATVFKSKTCKGFVGYGDANPSNVSTLVHGAEMRVAETRAVNRALRKAYGIGICSIEEIGSLSPPSARTHNNNDAKRPPQRVNGHGSNGQPRLRDQLCQLIREHQLDPLLVKSFALDFCGTQNLNQATREQIQNFIGVLSDQAKKDKPSLLCQLNSYSQSKQEGAA